ncbi:unnamed protein product [Zymoseptoria tritici ST99CH_1A5]|uniref:Mitochondrial splicing suppressor 51-like C-terminal domain-containing protein n=1 Tax=Zymoseptoria tritici ST99CH_1A5 TaxID=1276529 RepID=A0A1Y6LBB8_ZYMTR|nr:unnamed protein product [Zymoseptoria tritici ST99CH_1A5]
MEMGESSGEKSWSEYTEDTLYKLTKVQRKTSKLDQCQIGDIQQMIATQPHCIGCHQSRFQLSQQDLTLNTCKKCKIVATCAPCSAPHSAAACRQFRLITDLDLHSVERFEHGDKFSVHTKIKEPRGVDRYQPLSSYGGWERFMQSVDLIYEPEELFDPKLTAVMATESSTMPMTIVAALELSRPDLLEREELLLHLIGATSREFNRLDLFEDILHLLPGLKRLHVLICGPNAPMALGGPLNNPAQHGVLDNCGPCSVSGRQRTLLMFGGRYHEYLQDPTYRQPDLAVLFHSGRSQKDVESWAPTTRHLVNSGTPTLCTTQIELEATEEAEELDNIHAKFILRPERNPWRGLNPVPEFLDGEEHGAWYYNNFWYIFEGKKEQE